LAWIWQSPPSVQAYFAATRKIDREAWVACFAPDAESHDPVGAPSHRGHAGLRLFFDGIVGAVDSIAMWEDLVAPADSDVPVAWTMTGSGNNGRTFRFRGVDVFELDASGRIHRVKVYSPSTELGAVLSAWPTDCGRRGAGAVHPGPRKMPAGWDTLLG